MLNACKGCDTFILNFFVLKVNLQQDTENYKRNDFYKLPNRVIGTEKLEE